MKQLFYFFLVLGTCTTNAQEYYRNEIYNQNLNSEICSDIIIGDDSYYTFSVTFIYNEDFIYEGDLLVMREFTNEGELTQIDSLEIAGCTLHPQFSDNAIQTSDGGFLLAYHSCSTHLIKLDSNFNIEWNNVYDELINSVTVIEKEEGFLLVGQVDVAGQGDIWLGMIDEGGNLLNVNTFGDANLHDRIHCVEKTHDGGYLLSGGRYFYWNPLVIKVDSLGYVEWEHTFGNDYQHGWGIGTPQSDSTYLFAYARAVDDDLMYPQRELKLVLFNSNGELIEELYSSELKNDFIVYDIEIAGDDIYILFQQHSEVVSDPTGFRESGVLKYNLTTGQEWERIYHRGEGTSQDRFSLYDLELIETPENEISILIAGNLFDYSTTGSLLQCTWVVGADCEGYPVYPELNISSELIDEGSPGDVLFENIGTQVNDLNWWFSNGEMSDEYSPELSFENNGAYEIELTAPYCGETISATDTFYVEGIGIEELLSTRKTLVRTIDVLGREISRDYTGHVIDVFDDGTVRKRFSWMP